MTSKLLARISPTAGLKSSLGKHQHLNRDGKKARREKTLRRFNGIEKRMKPNGKGLWNWDRWDGSLWRTEDLGHYHQAWHHPQAKHAQDGINALLHQMPLGGLREVDHFWLLHHQAELHAHTKIDRFYKTLSEMCAVEFLLRTAPTKISKRFTETTQGVGSITMALSLELNHLHKVQTVLAHAQHNPLYSKFLTSLYQGGAEVRDFRSRILVKRKTYRLQLKETSRQDWGGTYINFDRENNAMLSKFIELRRIRGYQLISSDSQSFSALDSIAKPFALAVAMNRGKLRTIILTVKKLARNGHYVGFGMFLQRLRGLFTSMEENIRSMALTSLDLTALRYYRASKFPSSISDKEIELHKSLDKLVKSEHCSPVRDSRSVLRLPFPGSEGRPPHSSNRKVTERVEWDNI